MAHVLLLATAQNLSTRITHGWATQLQTTLSASHACTFIDRWRVSLATFRAHVSSADFIIFYGEGEPDRIRGQVGIFPAAGNPTLIDVSNVADFRGLPVYLVCCWALNDLGDAYTALYPDGAMVGYGAAFGFSLGNHTPFRDIVNEYAERFVGGTSAAQVAGGLAQAWDKLAEDFMNGPLKRSTPDFIVAGFATASNAKWVGNKP